MEHRFEEKFSGIKVTAGSENKINLIIPPR
jgi:hypothetical protein